MTTVYFIRHAESDNSDHDNRNRPLTEKGFTDRGLVTEFLQDKNIDAVLSSPYKRAVDTVAEFASKQGLDIDKIEGFREQDEEGWSDDEQYFIYNKKQWADFTLKSQTGESLANVQNRNIAALNDALARYKGKTIVVGTHGTALSTIINHYDKSYDFNGFLAMVNIKPWVVRMDFDDNSCVRIEKIDLFQI